MRSGEEIGLVSGAGCDQRGSAKDEIEMKRNLLMMAKRRKIRCKKEDTKEMISLDRSKIDKTPDRPPAVHLR